MNWDQVEGQWKQMKGSLRERWGKLTDDDLDVIAGNRDKFIGKVQERYGIAREEAQKKADEWLASIREAASAKKAHDTVKNATVKGTA
jgi:uncharacterized protein YjbJ (UPF0337 family)